MQYSACYPHLAPNSARYFMRLSLFLMHARKPTGFTLSVHCVFKYLSEKGEEGKTQI